MTPRSQEIPTRSVQHAIGGTTATDKPQHKLTERTDDKAEEAER